MSSIAPVEALMTIDIGNTRIGMAVSDADGVHHPRHVNLDQPDTWHKALEATWNVTNADQSRGVVLASVVHKQTDRLRRIAEDICGVEPLGVGDDIPLPMPLDVDNPLEVGVDRVCAAAAAYERVNEACAVASFGSATTIDCVSAKGRFLGGAILPGFEMAYAALHSNTDALPRVESGAPKSPFGKCTNDAIVNGVTFGMVGALREIVERYASELGSWPHLVITGGGAPLIAGLADFIDDVVPDLCLMGVALAYRRAAEAS